MYVFLRTGYGWKQEFCHMTQWPDTINVDVLFENIEPLISHGLVVERFRYSELLIKLQCYAAREASDLLQYED